MYYYPGFPALTVPYHDIYDFYFSGHVAAIIIYFLTFRAEKMKSMWMFSIFVLFLQSFMLVVLRTHYIIDLITGAIFAHWCFIVGEKISYYYDVKLLGLNG